MELTNENILIFGGTGSLGKALIRRLSRTNTLAIYSRDEAKHWTIRNQMRDQSLISFFVGDIRDSNRITEVISKIKPSIVIIASALKQVDTCEISPFESIQTNTLGIRNVCETVIALNSQLPNLHTVLLVSTDKACAPTNVYGMTKGLAERIVTSYQSYESKIKFVAVRYGNVLESRGSIIPLFKHQIEKKDALTVTDERMTRFIMTLDQSIDLIENTINTASTGQIWIPRIPAMRILDLATIFAKRSDSKIQITGMRPGEKLHEDLISEPESIRTRNLNRHYVIDSPFSTQSPNVSIFNYTSNQDVLEIQALEDYLESLHIFDMEINDFLGREIEEIRGR
jgi:UDP-N-acetylglucosamine 4,6-dehydratase